MTGIDADEGAATAPPDLPLRAGTVDPHQRERHVIRLPAAASAGLAALAAGAGVPEDAALLAALVEVVRTWAARPDFTVGLRRAGTVAEGAVAEKAVVTVLAERGDGAFARRATVLGERIAGAGPVAPPPVPPVVRASLDCGSAGDPGPAPLIDVAFAHRADGLEVTWDVAAGAFPTGVIAAATRAHLRLLGLLGSDPRAWHERRFDLVPAADRELVARVNDTRADLPGLLLQEFMAAAARRDPAAEAVVDGRRRLTYRELLSYANRIGRRLRDHATFPARPGELVAVVADKGWEQYAAVYGVLTAGAAYLPIDASVPGARLARLLARARVRHVLTQSWLDERPMWPEGVVRHRVDTDFETGDDSPLPAAQQPDHPAYVILTSGSTGEPKGVTVDHRAVANLAMDVNSRFGVRAGDRLFAISGLHFDASVYDVFGVMAAGATAVLPDPFTRAEPDRWVERVRTEAVTFWNSVPALMEMVVGHAEVRTDQPLASLRLAVLSGDWIPLTLPDRLRAQAPKVQVVGSGGPTETVCWSVFYPIGEIGPEWRSIPYGKPISNQRYYIVDDEWRQRPVLVPGQMAVASDIGLAQGYWNDEARTRERFVILPETGERAYLTGDLGRYLPDGNIEILGRDDFQVKIQGYRIELGEIEAALRDHPAVDHAVVIAPPAGTGGVRRLHGFVTLHPGRAADEDGLRAALREVLPGYLVPAQVTVLDRLPLTPNGKVDRLTLAARAKGTVPAPVPDRPGPNGSDSGAAGPVSALESLLAAAVAEVLGLERVGRHDNFFRLGGDSLGGVRVLRRLQELTGVDVPLRLLFDHPALSDLAAVLAADPEHGRVLVSAAERLDALLAESLTVSTG